MGSPLSAIIYKKEIDFPYEIESKGISGSREDLNSRRDKNGKLLVLPYMVF